MVVPTFGDGFCRAVCQTCLIFRASFPFLIAGLLLIILFSFSLLCCFRFLFWPINMSASGNLAISQVMDRLPYPLRSYVPGFDSGVYIHVRHFETTRYCVDRPFIFDIHLNEEQPDRIVSCVGCLAHCDRKSVIGQSTVTEVIDSTFNTYFEEKSYEPKLASFLDVSYTGKSDTPKF